MSGTDRLKAMKLATGLSALRAEPRPGRELTAALRADTARNEAILERIPASRWGTPDDLAGPAIFLSSSASDYVTGYTLAVDGGWLAR